MTVRTPPTDRLTDRLTSRLTSRLTDPTSVLPRDPT